MYGSIVYKPYAIRILRYKEKAHDIFSGGRIHRIGPNTS